MTKDPYRYFRIEARELLEGLGTSVLDLEKAPSDKDVIGRLLRLAHTLKGASRVVKLAAIAQDAHAIEDVLAPFREAPAPVPQADLNRLLQLVDGIGARVAAIDPASEPEKAAAPRAAPEEASETVRVEIDEVDRLLESVTEATVLVNALARQSASLDHAQRLAEVIVGQLAPQRAGEVGAAVTRELAVKVSSLAEELSTSLERIRRDVDSGFEQVGSELRQVRDAANRLRLLPASSVFPSLERAARDAAHSVGRPIAFEASGGEIRLDAHVLAALRDALIHVVRNAVAHGIEGEVERAAAGFTSTELLGQGEEQLGHASMKVEGSAIRVKFAHAAGLAAKDGPLKWFQIAGIDQKFVDADAKIDGDSVIISSPGVPAPVAYFPFSGWKDSFFGDLHGQGRDAIEFYTDKKVVIERWS